MRARGENCDVEEIRLAIGRDQSDRGREDAPLTVPIGAIRVDTVISASTSRLLLIRHVRERCDSDVGNVHADLRWSISRRASRALPTVVQAVLVGCLLFCVLCG